MLETNQKGGSRGAKNSSWYEKWHSNDHYKAAHWAIFIMVIVTCYALLANQINDWLYQWNGEGVAIKVTKPSAKLSLNPQNQAFSVGETFTANIMLDTGGKPIDGVDIYSLHYDPSLLQVIDDNPNTSGVQIQPGTILNQNTANIVEPKTGTIKFGQVASGGTNYTGRGVLATIHFKALATGSAYLKFDFSKGSTVDSNAAYRGKDQLTSVVDAIYTIQPAK